MISAYLGYGEISLVFYPIKSFKTWNQPIKHLVTVKLRFGPRMREILYLVEILCLSGVSAYILSKSASKKGPLFLGSWKATD